MNQEKGITLLHKQLHNSVFLLITYEQYTFSC